MSIYTYVQSIGHLECYAKKLSSNASSCATNLRRIINLIQTIPIESTDKIYPLVITQCFSINTIHIKLLLHKFIYLACKSNEQALMVCNSLMLDSRNQSPLIRKSAFKTLAKISKWMYEDFKMQCWNLMIEALEDPHNLVKSSVILSILNLFKDVNLAYESNELFAIVVNKLYSLIKNSDSLVVLNSLVTLDKILEKEGGVVINKKISQHLTNQFENFHNLHKPIILSYILKYLPQNSNELMMNSQNNLPFSSAILLANNQEIKSDLFKSNLHVNDLLLKSMYQNAELSFFVFDWILRNNFSIIDELYLSYVSSDSWFLKVIKLSFSLSNFLMNKKFTTSTAKTIYSNINTQDDDVVRQLFGTVESEGKEAKKMTRFDHINNGSNKKDSTFKLEDTEMNLNSDLHTSIKKAFYLEEMVNELDSVGNVFNNSKFTEQKSKIYLSDQNLDHNAKEILNNDRIMNDTHFNEHDWLRTTMKKRSAYVRSNLNQDLNASENSAVKNLILQSSFDLTICATSHIDMMDGHDLLLNDDKLGETQLQDDDMSSRELLNMSNKCLYLSEIKENGSSRNANTYEPSINDKTNFIYNALHVNAEHYNAAPVRGDNIQSHKNDSLHSGHYNSTHFLEGLKNFENNNSYGMLGERGSISYASLLEKLCILLKMEKEAIVVEAMLLTIILTFYVQSYFDTTPLCNIQLITNLVFPIIKRRLASVPYLATMLMQHLPLQYLSEFEKNDLIDFAEYLLFEYNDGFNNYDEVNYGQYFDHLNYESTLNTEADYESIFKSNISNDEAGYKNELKFGYINLNMAITKLIDLNRVDYLYILFIKLLTQKSSPYAIILQFLTDKSVFNHRTLHIVKKFASKLSSTNKIRPSILITQLAASIEVFNYAPFEGQMLLGRTFELCDRECFNFERLSRSFGSLQVVNRSAEHYCIDPQSRDKLFSKLNLYITCNEDDVENEFKNIRYDREDFESMALEFNILKFKIKICYDRLLRLSLDIKNSFINSY